jgi:hypothetical protein
MEKVCERKRERERESEREREREKSVCVCVCMCVCVYACVHSHALILIYTIDMAIMYWRSDMWESALPPVDGVKNTLKDVAHFELWLASMY